MTDTEDERARVARFMDDQERRQAFADIGMKARCDYQSIRHSRGS